MRVIVFLLTLLATLFFCSPGLAQSGEPSAPDYVILTEDQGEYPLGLYMELLEDPSGVLTIEDVSSPAFESQFTHSQAATPNYGYTDSAYWVRLNFYNQTTLTDNWLLDLGHAQMQYVDLYTPLPDGEGFSVKQSGVLRPPETRDLRHPGIIFSVLIPAQNRQTIYMRFQNGASMTLPLTLWKQKNFINHAIPKDGLLLIVSGILIGLLAYNIFLFLLLRDSSYLYLVLFLASYLFWSASNTGYTEIYLFSRLYYLKTYYHPLAFSVMFVSMILFSDTVLELKMRLSSFHWVMIFLLSGWGFLLLLVPFTRFSTYGQTIVIWGLVSSIAAAAAGIIVWKQGYIAVRYFLIGWFGLLGSFSLNLLVRLGLIPSSFITENLYQVGTVWMAVCWSIALADRINLLKADTERANRDLQKSEQRLSSILEAMPVGVVLYAKDHKPRYGNQRTIDILSNVARRLRPDLVEGRTIEQAIQFFSLKPAGDDDAYPLENFPVFRALQGEPAYADDIEIDWGDERIPLEVWANPVRDEDGNIEAAIAVFQDITKRKQAEAELIEYRNQLEALVKERTAELENSTEELNNSNKELRLRLEWLAAINLVNQIVARSANFKQIYKRITEVINNLFGAKDSFLAELDERGRRSRILTHSCSSDLHYNVIDSLITFPKKSYSSSNLDQGKPFFITKEQLSSLDGPMGNHFRASEMQSLLLVPLQRREKILGFLGLEFTEEARTITTEELSLLNIFSSDIAQLIEDVRQFEQTKALIAAEERNRLARDLHDSVTQALFSATLVADVLPQIWRRDPALGLQELNKLKRLTYGGLAEMRTMLLELRPSAVTKTSLGELLPQLAEAVASRSGLAFQLFIERVPILPESVQLNFYRIAQEALNNVVKHAQATQVSVSINITRLTPDSTGEILDEVTMKIQDDGVGFAAEKRRSGQLGISIMEERAAAIHASLSVESRPGHGTEVAITWRGEVGSAS